MREVAEGVAHVHACGVLHRDLKPDNVLFAEDGRPLVMDFGLARIGLERSSLTHTYETLGTPVFMAPEQAQGAEGIDFRADVYGLGGILYQCLTGELPFVGTSHLEVLAQVIADPPRRPRSFAPDLDPALEAICLRALEKDPEQRYPSAAAFAAALAEWAAGAAAPPARRGAPRRLVLGGGLGLGLALLLGLALQLQRADDETRARPSPSATPTQRASAAPAPPRWEPPRDPLLLVMEVEQSREGGALIGSVAFRLQAKPDAPGTLEGRIEAARCVLGVTRVDTRGPAGGAVDGNLRRLAGAAVKLELDLHTGRVGELSGVPPLAEELAGGQFDEGGFDELAKLLKRAFAPEALRAMLEASLGVFPADAAERSWETKHRIWVNTLYSAEVSCRYHRQDGGLSGQLRSASEERFLFAEGTPPQIRGFTGTHTIELLPAARWPRASALDMRYREGRAEITLQLRLKTLSPDAPPW